MNWHDNYIHSFGFNAEKFELALDIDYIYDWLDGEGADYNFLISPATLTFQNVSNLKINLDWKEYALDLCIFSIDRLNPRKTANAKMTEYDWEILISWPEGKISFCATGFTQISRAKPAVFNEQKITGGRDL